MYARDYEGARLYLDETLRLAPNSLIGLLFAMYLEFAEENAENALRHARRFADLRGNDAHSLVFLAAAQALAGNRDAALSSLADSRSRQDAGEGYASESLVGLVHLMLGDRATALTWLERGLEAGVKVAEMAKERDMTAGQLALLWLKDQPGVTSPIIGPRTVDHLKEFLPVLESTLNDDDRPLFDELVHPGNAVADFHNSNEWMKARIKD